jgi:hypothetical protein
LIGRKKAQEAQKNWRLIPEALSQVGVGPTGFLRLLRLFAATALFETL